MSESAKVTGTVWRGSRIRAAVEPTAGGNTLTNLGPDPINISAAGDMSSPTAVAVGATSGTLAARRYIETAGNNGHATVRANGDFPGASLRLVNDPNLLT